MIFPQNNCIYSYYVLFQDSAKWVSAKREDTPFRAKSRLFRYGCLSSTLVTPDLYIHPTRRRNQFFHKIISKALPCCR